MKTMQYFTLAGHENKPLRLTTGKKGLQLARSSKRKEGFFLSDVYGRYSINKAIAWDSCYNECKAVNGQDFRIISHNSSFFSVAYEVIDSTTGQVITVIITAYNKYYVEY